MESVLVVKNLSKNFGKIRAIQNISFSIEKGKVVGLLGPNGSGKTTTLSIVIGLKKASGGLFSWFNLPEGETENKRIGSLIEVPYFYPYLTLSRNLEIVAKVKGINSNQIPKTLDVVGLANRASTKFQTLSLGMKQRLAIASALLGNPEVLVLDEPTNGLDPEGISEVREIIINLSKLGKTILLASHILDEVEKVCSDVIILKQGKIISQGSVNELLSEKHMVILSADNNENLYSQLSNYKRIEIVEKRSDCLLIALDDAGVVPEINQWLMQKGTVLTRIEPVKKTLESQFLQIIKQ
ncbi:MAG: ATP-binding cassette domain-containing protein [Bacteroidales bacterium]|nr:ATP-binding cassette domain-containing protein [Bacteroidales bacterium]MDD3892261.1 ATP-binding cassette domain-containing protein [Bacteroidales bacterium]